MLLSALSDAVWELPKEEVPGVEWEMLNCRRITCVEP